MPGSGVLDILEWRRGVLAKQPLNGTTPLEVGDGLAKSAAADCGPSRNFGRCRG